MLSAEGRGSPSHSARRHAPPIEICTLGPALERAGEAEFGAHSIRVIVEWDR